LKRLAPSGCRTTTIKYVLVAPNMACRKRVISEWRGDFSSRNGRLVFQ
jgi:hypothetical protein